jgi:hypothetical protein
VLQGEKVRAINIAVDANIPGHREIDKPARTNS